MAEKISPNSQKPERFNKDPIMIDATLMLIPFAVPWSLSPNANNFWCITQFHWPYSKCCKTFGIWSLWDEIISPVIFKNRQVI